MNTIIYRILLAASLILLPVVGLRAQNIVSAEAVAVTEGQEWKLSVLLKNSSDYAAFQVDIVVPEGVTLKDGSLKPSNRLVCHTAEASTLPDGTIRVVAYNGTNEGMFLYLDPEELFTITLVASPELTDPGARAVLRNLRFTDTDLKEDVLTALTVPLAVNTPTGIQTLDVQPMITAGKVYDLNGRRVAVPQRGHIYIVNGKKVLF